MEKPCTAKGAAETRATVTIQFNHDWTPMIANQKCRKWRGVEASLSIRVSSYYYPAEFSQAAEILWRILNRRDAKFRRGVWAMISAHLRVSAVNPDLIGTLGAASPRCVHSW